MMMNVMDTSANILHLQNDDFSYKMAATYDH